MISDSKLLYGIQNSARPERNREALHQFLAPIEVLELLPDFGDTYGQVRLDLKKRGKPVGELDLLIGVHALSLGVTLVTNNVREFKSIKGLAVENWA